MKELQRRRRCQEQERANAPRYVLFCPVLFYSVLLCSALFWSVLFCPVLSCPVQSGHVLSCSVMICSSLPESTKPTQNSTTTPHSCNPPFGDERDNCPFRMDGFPKYAHEKNTFKAAFACTRTAPATLLLSDCHTPSTLLLESTSSLSRSGMSLAHPTCAHPTSVCTDSAVSTPFPPNQMRARRGVQGVWGNCNPALRVTCRHGVLYPREFRPREKLGTLARQAEHRETRQPINGGAVGAAREKIDNSQRRRRCQEQERANPPH
eukprot:gene23068-biopygen14844